ncbi:MAG TPA: SDR family NAD(P)-dependent oxidoreductase [Devosiaceae bacterium]|nr:SDR family NAD(P)-dependent oxidoreductase [Devosiaceae bacterium]
MSQVWLVTGSSRGLGHSIVKAALEAGHRVVATARNPQQVADLVEQYGADRVSPFALDVTDAEAAQAAVKHAVDTFGRLDVVVNNAGYGDTASVEDVTLQDFKAQIDTVFYGTVYVTKAAVPVMREQGSGHIIQITSVGRRLHSPGLAAYQSAKWAVEGFSGVLALEIAPLGIKTTIIEPGGFRTDWAGSSMKIPPISEPYQQTVGAYVQRFRNQGSAAFAGDPDKAGEVIVQVAQLPEPPLRLILGKAALEYATAFDAARTASDAKWKDLSLLTEADD